MQAFSVPTMAELSARGEQPEVLFWIGCAGSFDPNTIQVTQSFARLMQSAGIRFAVLGAEESCSGDPARRAGNEFLFQMQALNNIQLLNSYQITKIVTACPHCFNTLKNEYPELGGVYEVLHHTELLQQLITSGRLKVEGGAFKGKRITFHDPCYLGRNNGQYEAPRYLLEQLEAQTIEMTKHKKRSLCCGAGGAQAFKEAEKGEKEINALRSEQVIATGADVVATGCPFCKLMLLDGLKNKGNAIPVLDVAELIEKNKTHY